MGVLCLFIQEQRSRLNLFLHSKEELLQHQTLIISKQFAKYIQKVTDMRGDVVLLNRYRAVFVLLNEVYIVAVCYVNDYPFDALRCVNNAKKKYGQIMLALEELLNETNTFKDPAKEIDIISKSKLSDTLNNGSKTKRGTIRKIERVIDSNVNVHWQETKKSVEVHNKRFEALEKFKLDTSADTVVRDEELLLSQFSDDFSAPTDEPLPNFNRQRAQSTFDRDNGLSGNRLKQLNVLTKGNLEMLDDTFGTLVTPTYIPPTRPTPILPTPPTLNGYDHDEDDDLVRNKKLANDFNLLRVDTESPDNSESSDTFTSHSTTERSTTGRNSLSNIDSPASKGLSLGLDDFLTSGPKSSTVTPPITKANGIPKTNTPLISLEDLLDGPVMGFTEQPPLEPMRPTPLPPLQPNPVFYQPEPPIQTLNTTIPKPPPTNIPPPMDFSIRPPPVQQQQVRPPPVQQTNPVQEQKRPIQQMPVFDPSQILKKFEERAHVIYLTAVVREKLEVVYTGSTRAKYQLIGEVMVKPFSSDKSHNLKHHEFILSLSRTEKLANVKCNPKYCTQINQEYNFNCQVQTEDIEKNPVVLLRYKLHDNVQPMPIVLQPKFKLSSLDNTMTLMVKYKVNPETPLKNLSMLVQPVTKEHSEKDLSVVGAQSKPEGRWTQQQQKLLWRLSDVKFNPDEKQGSSLVAKFKMNKDPSTLPSYVPGAILIKLNNEGTTFSGVYVEGGDSKRNAVTNQVFVGGCEYGIDCTDFQYILTQEALVTQ